MVSLALLGGIALAAFAAIVVGRIILALTWRLVVIAGVAIGTIWVLGQGVL